MRNDLEQIVRLDEARMHRLEIERLMLEPHGAGGDAHRAVIQRSDQRVLVNSQGRLRIFFRKSPKLAATVNRRSAIQEHGVSVAAVSAVELHRDDLTGLGVVAEPS